MEFNKQTLYFSIVILRRFSRFNNKNNNVLSYINQIKQVNILFFCHHNQECFFFFFRSLYETTPFLIMNDFKTYLSVY